MGPIALYAASVDGHDGSCEGSLVGEERSTVPRRGLVPPPLGAIANTAPAPSGAGGGGRRSGGVGV